MTRLPVLSRLIASLAVAVAVAAGASATAQAKPYNKLCAGGVCFHKDTQGYTNDRTYFYITFNGSAVTHYNIRYREEGGREKQAEIATRPGSNKSYEKSLKGVPGKKYSVSIQACVRVVVKVGPVKVGTRSNCTTWKRFGYYAV